MTLDLLPPRRRAEIVAVDWAVLAPEEAKRLRALGIDEGARVAIAHRGIFAGRDPIALDDRPHDRGAAPLHARAMTVEPSYDAACAPPRWSAIPMRARARCSTR